MGDEALDADLGDSAESADSGDEAESADSGDEAGDAAGDVAGGSSTVAFFGGRRVPSWRWQNPRVAEDVVCADEGLGLGLGEIHSPPDPLPRVRPRPTAFELAVVDPATARTYACIR